MTKKRGITARAGRWSAQHPWLAISGWLAIVVAAVLLGGAIGTKTLSDSDYGVGESGRADEALVDGFGDEPAESVLVQHERLAAGAPAFRAQVREVRRRLRSTEGVGRVGNPYRPGSEDSAISADGRSALVGFTLTDGGVSDPDYAEIVGAPLAAVADLQAGAPAFTIEEFGEASADAAVTETFESDFRRAEATSLPITLIILIVAFGALVAAFVPLLLAATAVAGAIGLLAPLSQIWAMDEAVASVVLLIGLAVGVDYSMFYLRREREERARGRGPEAALEAAAATSGRAVLVSGVTVMIAMSGMYLTGDASFISFATGTITVVAIAVMGSLTVLPAVLSKLGDRVNKGRIPFLRRPEQRAGSEPRAWGAIVDRVMRRPKLWGGLAASLLVLMAIPALGLKMAVPGIDSLPQDLAVLDTYEKIDEAFPGNQLPATIAIESTAAASSELNGAVRDLRGQVAESPLFEQPVEVERSRDRSVVRIDVPLAGDGSNARSDRALAELRGEIVPATVGAVPGATANVTGYTAQSADFDTLMAERMPLVFVFVLGLAFVLLTVTFRSIVIPIKAIVLNLLSVGAAYGLVVWIFQEGHLESLLGFSSSGAVAPWLPMFLFVILFGLSMDYHVFILSRVREAVDRGLSTEDAVAEGIKSTAGVVTAAAVVMVAVFSIFATLSLLEMKQFGVGLGAAILIDATIVRGVLLPASMKLLGDWNWYLPSGLDWLPRVGADRAEPEPEPAEA